MDKDTMRSCNQLIRRIVDNVEKVIYGKREVVGLVLCTLMARGHVLIEDIPGVGKTLLVNSLARSLQLSFGRIQCTPDLMPADIVGYNLYNMQTGKMDFKTGMIMHQLVLADEINRASPKVQSSLLEVMEEYQVSVDGTTFKVPLPFMVLATQNPIEYVGTSPLPEAQMDRFMMRITLGYPDAANELRILNNHYAQNPIEDIHAVAGAEEILWLQEKVPDVHVSRPVKDYILALSAATRKHPDLILGASPRASLALMRASQAYSLMLGKDFVTPDEVQELVHPVIGHRLLQKTESKMRGRTGNAILNEILASVKVPAL